MFRLSAVPQHESSSLRNMASADLSFTKDGLIYRPDHQEEDEDDFLVEHARKEGGEPREAPTGQAASI